MRILAKEGDNIYWTSGGDKVANSNLNPLTKSTAIAVNRIDNRPDLYNYDFCYSASGHIGWPCRICGGEKHPCNSFIGHVGSPCVLCKERA